MLETIPNTVADIAIAVALFFIFFALIHTYFFSWFLRLTVSFLFSYTIVNLLLNVTFIQQFLNGIQKYKFIISTLLLS